MLPAARESRALRCSEIGTACVIDCLQAPTRRRDSPSPCRTLSCLREALRKFDVYCCSALLGAGQGTPETNHTAPLRTNEAAGSTPAIAVPGAMAVMQVPSSPGMVVGMVRA